ncbi:MAG: NUDIX domain-containing protein [Thermoplasmata archaeon]|nr:NUDIX domain-containing protein [Thermoplasmata archaeon]
MSFVYAVAFSGKKFVMVRHRRRAWEMPGGSIESDENPEEAIDREFLEETGMHFKPIGHIPLGDGIVFFGVAKGWPRRISNEVAEVSLFDILPDRLSFPREEYIAVLQEARKVVKNYIKGDSIGDFAPQH